MRDHDRWNFRAAWFVAAIGVGAAARGTVVSYEGEVFPEIAGWERINFAEISRLIDDGIFEQFVHEQGIDDSYRLSLAQFAGEKSFFVEWRVQTDAPRSVLDARRIPVVLVAGGNSAAFYHTTITDSRVRFFRDTFLPLVFADIDFLIPHTYRLELLGTESYAWYIDGHVVDGGVPQGPYPNPDSRITWGVRREMYDSTTRWHYLRFGIIPQAASGDFDTNDSIELSDFYFFHECQVNDRLGIHGGPDEDAGPGCRWADMSGGDGDVDLADFAAFQNSFDGGQ